MKGKNHWTATSIIKEFSQYKTPTEARLKSYGAWKAMKRLAPSYPQLEEQALSHMKRKKSWKKSDIIKEVKKVQSMKELREVNPPLYHYLWRLNQTSPMYVKSLTAHFKEPLPEVVRIVHYSKHLLTEIINLEHQIQYSISARLKVRVNENLSVEDLKTKLLPNLDASGELPVIGSYLLSGNLKEESIQKNSLGSYFTLELTLTLFKSIPFINNCSVLKNLVIDPYYEWLTYSVPSILDSIKPEVQTLNNTYGINDELILKFIKDSKFKISEDGSLMKLNDSGCRFLPYSLKPQEGSIRIKYHGSNLVLARIIYAKFHGSLDSSKIVYHKDGNKLNNHKDNLVQLSPSECMKIQFLTKRRNPVKGNSKLSEEQITQIRTWRQEGLPYKQILKLCIDSQIPLTSKGHLSNIINKKTWRVNESQI